MTAERFDPSTEPDAATSAEQDIREIPHNETLQQPTHRPALDQSGLDAQRQAADLPRDEAVIDAQSSKDAQSPNQPPRAP